MQDFNQSIITEFRANAGKVGGPFANSTLLLLTTTGAKSGQQRITPLATLKDGDRLVIIASKAGAPTNPDWYHNILAHPEVTVEIGTERFQARATVADESERKRLYAQMAEKAPVFADYEKKTERKIPVVLLERIG
jgi:deazaflavin-dependent oxidoreductase (nitroreductase family)